MCTGKIQAICTSFDSSHQDTIERNKYAVKAVIDLIAVYGKQNVPLRDHTDEHSNFHAFLNFCADGDATLKQHLQLAPSNAKYCGHQIQNEISGLCGKQLQNTIRKKCNIKKDNKRYDQIFTKMYLVYSLS